MSKTKQGTKTVVRKIPEVYFLTRAKNRGSTFRQTQLKTIGITGTKQQDVNFAEFVQVIEYEMLFLGRHGAILNDNMKNIYDMAYWCGVTQKVEKPQEPQPQINNLEDIKSAISQYISHLPKQEQPYYNKGVNHTLNDIKASLSMQTIKLFIQVWEDKFIVGFLAGNDYEPQEPTQQELQSRNLMVEMAEALTQETKNHCSHCNQSEIQQTQSSSKIAYLV